MTEEFRAHPIYYLLTIVSALLLLLLSWNLLHMVTMGALLFVAVAGFATIWFGGTLGAQIQLSPTALTIHMPLRLFGPAGQRAIRTIAHRQLVSVDQSGRFLAVLTVLYYPKRADGLLDLEQLATVTLPLVTDQATLRDRLDAAIPR